MPENNSSSSSKLQMKKYILVLVNYLLHSNYYNLRIIIYLKPTIFPTKTSLKRRFSILKVIEFGESVTAPQQLFVETEKLCFSQMLQTTP